MASQDRDHNAGPEGSKESPPPLFQREPSLPKIITRTLLELVVTTGFLTIFMTPQNRAYWPTVIGLGVVSVGVVIVRARKSRHREAHQDQGSGNWH
jgi:hypothetical protein